MCALSFEGEEEEEEEERVSVETSPRTFRSLEDSGPIFAPSPVPPSPRWGGAPVLLEARHFGSRGAGSRFMSRLRKTSSSSVVPDAFVLNGGLEGPVDPGALPPAGLPCA
ncbi:unnamed protein product [Lota lota]